MENSRCSGTASSSGIGNKKTLFRPGEEPVQDIDGDGKMEIVVSQFNTTGDDKWHVVALDAMTGA